MTTSYPVLSEILLQDFQKKQARNGSYSIRAYARHLTLQPSTLLNLMKGKTSGSKDVLKRLSTKLALSDSDCLYLLKIAKLKQTKVLKRREQIFREIMRLDTRFNLVSDDDFRQLGFWQCFAVMELIKLKNAKLDPSWIARKLKITETQAKASLQALIQHKIIEVSKTGDLKVLKDFITLPSGIKFDLARTFHGELMKKAQSALFDQSEGERNISSLVLRFRNSDLLAVDQFIKNFRRNFSATFEHGEGHDSVYGLCVQFFRLDDSLETDSDHPRTAASVK